LKLYEGMFLLDNRQANRDWEGSLDALKGMIAKHGGEVVRCQKWGERRLSYEIKGRRRGTYVLAYFQGDADAVNRIYREVELSEIVLRALMLRINALPPEGQPLPQLEGEPRRGRSGLSRRRESRGRASRAEEARPQKEQAAAGKAAADKAPAEKPPADKGAAEEAAAQEPAESGEQSGGEGA